MKVGTDHWPYVVKCDDEAEWTLNKQPIGRGYDELMDVTLICGLHRADAIMAWPNLEDHFVPLNRPG